MFESWKEREFEKRWSVFAPHCRKKHDLIGAGAGLSTSAGFTYSGERFRKYFADLNRNTVSTICILAASTLRYAGRILGVVVKAYLL